MDPEVFEGAGAGEFGVGAGGEVGGVAAGIGCLVGILGGGNKGGGKGNVPAGVFPNEGEKVVEVVFAEEGFSSDGVEGVDEVLPEAFGTWVGEVHLQWVESFLVEVVFADHGHLRWRHTCCFPEKLGAQDSPV